MLILAFIQSVYNLILRRLLYTLVRHQQYVMSCPLVRLCHRL